MPHRKYDPELIRRGFDTDPDFARAIWGENIVHIREIARQQILGDRELLADIIAGREPNVSRELVEARLWFVERIAHFSGLGLPLMELLPLSQERSDLLPQLRQLP